MILVEMTTSTEFTNTVLNYGTCIPMEKVTLYALNEGAFTPGKLSPPICKLLHYQTQMI